MPGGSVRDAWAASSVRLSAIIAVLLVYFIYVLPYFFGIWFWMIVPWLLLVLGIGLAYQAVLGLYEQRSGTPEDAFLVEGWYWGWPPLALWFWLAIIAFPIFGICCLTINMMTLLMERMPFVGAWFKHWRPCSADDVERAISLALGMCDRESVDMAVCPKESFRAVTCQGIGFRSIRYFGHAYYLLKHGLVNKETHFIGYSMASGVVAALACAAAQETQEARIGTLRRGIAAYASFGLECGPNALWGAAGVVRLTQTMVGKIRDALPENVVMLRGKLHLYVTRILDPRPLLVVSDWTTRDDLIEVMGVSCYWPWTWNLLPLAKFKDDWCADGGFALRCPVPAKTLETSPCMTCTLDDSGVVLSSMIRMSLPPGSEADIVSEILAGYRHAHRMHKKMMKAD